MTLWVLVANSSFAEIYSIKGKTIERVHQLDFPEGRLKSGEIESDRPGRTFDRPSRGAGGASQGTSRHSYGSEVDAHTHEQEIFAHRIADILYKDKAQNKYDQIDIIAPPQFLGDLRKVLPEIVKKSVKREINKEIPSSLSEHERIESIRRYLELPSPASSLG